MMLLRRSWSIFAPLLLVGAASVAAAFPPDVVQRAKTATTLVETDVDLGSAFCVDPAGITSLRRSKGVSEQVQTDGSVKPGNSGGPMVEELGPVIAVVQAIVPGAGTISSSSPPHVTGTALNMIPLPPHSLDENRLFSRECVGSPTIGGLRDS